MNRADIADLVGLIDVYSPGFASEDRVRALIAVWAVQLQDIDVESATWAVHAHYAMESRWVSTADIRRRVASRRGLLPPDPETAYAQACEFNRWLGRRVGPEPDIHPVALETARKIKWSAFDAPPGVVHRQFIDAYRPAAEKATTGVLTGNFIELTAASNAPKALPGGVGVEAAAAEERAREPINHEQASELKRQIAKSGIVQFPAPPRPDYAPPTEVEWKRWAAGLKEWALQTGNPYVVQTEEKATEEKAEDEPRDA